MAGEDEAGHAFISHAPEDLVSAERLQQALEAAGIRVWRDVDILPGEDWRARIRRAVRDDALVFIACFSRSRLSVGASRHNEEITLAVEQIRARPPDEPWLIPVKFDDCCIPDWDIGGGRTLESIRSADLFGERCDEETERLIRSVRRILAHPGRRQRTAGVPAAMRATIGASSMPFSRVLHVLRVDAGLSQEELAREAGLSLQMVGELERGANRTAERETVRLLADALGLTGVGKATFELAAHGLPSDRSAAGAQRKSGGLTAATRTLPRDAASFTGRERELRQLMDTAASVVDSGGVVGIHAIGGMAGIGKTALAVHAAHLLAERFPDGQIFLPLHGHTAGQAVVEPTDALASLLETAGVPARQIPRSLEARVRLWRDHLAGKRMLIVLDDAIGHEQVRPLLPGTARSLVLVTSRRHLTALEDARSLSLDTLPADQAAELLVQLASRPDLDAGQPAVAETVQLCGYLPLAIGMLARQLYHHPVWTVSDLAAELSAARDRLNLMQAENQSVTAAFDLSYQDLGQELQAFFRRLGLHPGTDIDVYAAAAIGGISPASARSALRSLYDQHLLIEHVHGRYRMHDLIREYSRILADSDGPHEQASAIGSLLQYYSQTASTANRLIPRGPARLIPSGRALWADCPQLASREEAIAWMNAERVNLSAAAGYAAAHGMYAYAIGLPAAMHGFLRGQGHWDDAIKLELVSVKIARQSGDRNSEAAALIDLGHTQRLSGDYGSAAASFARAKDLSHLISDTASEVRALVQLSIVHRLTGDSQAAIDTAERAVELGRLLTNRYEEAAALTELGAAQQSAGNPTAAAGSLAIALQLCRIDGDELIESAALDHLGVVQHTLGELAAAGRNLARALEIWRSIGNKHGEALALEHLGLLRQAEGRVKEAAQLLTESLELYRVIGSSHEQERAYNSLTDLASADKA